MKNGAFSAYGFDMFISLWGLSAPLIHMPELRCEFHANNQASGVPK
jgi:hypothetical protein